MNTTEFQCFFPFQDQTWAEHWDEATGEKLELNPHIPKPDPPKEEEKKEEEEKEKEEEKKDEDKVSSHLWWPSVIT